MNSRSPSARSETKAKAVRAWLVNRNGPVSTPGLAQRVGQEMAERVVADHAQKGARDPQPGQAHRDVGRGPARRLDEGRRVGEAGAGSGRHEVDQQIADADHLGHVVLLGPMRARGRAAREAPGGAFLGQCADQPL